MVVLGDREVCDEEITIRTQKGDDLGNMKLESFLERVTEEINN
jgi:Threonyl-tRNA synthetase